MKGNLSITIVGTVLLVLGGAMIGLSGEADQIKPSLIYGAFVDDYIQKCQIKATLLNSSSLNIRKNAMRATVKGAYMRHNRVKLVKYLMEKNVSLNPRRIKYHLNQQFAKVVQPNEVYSALVEESTDR